MESIIELFAANSVRLLIIAVLLLFGKIILYAIVSRIKRSADDNDAKTSTDIERRAETLGSVITATGNVVIYAIVLLMVLEIFNIDIRPILAGAGIVGLAVGFGAQSLVKDFVSGLFILIEDQYSVGDKVKIGSAEGTVEKISIRMTTLKGNDGQYIYISNGDATSQGVTNFSQKNS